MSSEIFESIDKSQLVELKKILQDICFSCAGLASICYSCSVNDAFDAIYVKQDLVTLENPVNESNILLADLLFEKNKLLLANDFIDQICVNCTYQGFSCLKCELHKVKRNLASLPVFEIQNKVLFDNSSEPAKKSCSTSCSTSCGVKK